MLTASSTSEDIRICRPETGHELGMADLDDFVDLHAMIADPLLASQEALSLASDP